MSDLVRNPKDRFSRVVAHLTITYLNILYIAQDASDLLGIVTL